MKDLHPQPPRSERDASASWANAAKQNSRSELLIFHAVKNWHSRQDWPPGLAVSFPRRDVRYREMQTHLHRRRSKRRTLVIELRERGKRRRKRARCRSPAQALRKTPSLILHPASSFKIGLPSRSSERRRRARLRPGGLRRGSLRLYAALRAKAGGLPRNRTVFSPGKSRDFTVKVCSPYATRRRS